MSSLAHLLGVKGDELESLRSAIHEPRSTVLPLVGSGLSLPADAAHAPSRDSAGHRLRLPTWKEMLVELGRKIPAHDATSRREFEECLQRGDLLQAADIVEARAEGGSRWIAEYIGKVFRDPPGARPPLYDSLARWPIDQFLTTNFDPWLEEALKRTRPQLDVKDPSDPGSYAELRASGAPFLFHLHGRARRPERCVLTHASFRKLIHAHPLHQKTLESFVAHRRLVYLGYSLRDPDPTLALEAWFAKLPESVERKHFLLDAQIPEHRTRELSELGVIAIDYGDHALLPELIEWLARPDAVAPARASELGSREEKVAVEPQPPRPVRAKHERTYTLIGLAGLLVVAAVVLVPPWLRRATPDPPSFVADALDRRIEALARQLPPTIDRALEGDDAFVSYCRTVSDTVERHFGERERAANQPLEIAEPPPLLVGAELDMAQLKLREEQLYRRTQDDPELRPRLELARGVVGILSARRAARDRLRDAAIARAERARDWLVEHAELAQQRVAAFLADVAAGATPYDVGLRPRSDLVPLTWSRERPAVFWVLGTGDEPRWDESTGRFALQVEGTAVAIALLPPTASGAREIPLSLGLTEFTAGQWSLVSAQRDTREVVPARGVDWYRALEACAVLGGWLPTLEQWDRACLAGAPGPYCFDDPSRAREFAWFEGDPLQLPQPVAGKLPNAWGLFDVHGNVFEWSATPAVEVEGRPFAYLRGGSLTTVRVEALSVLARSSAPRSARNDNTGFRLAIAW